MTTTDKSRAETTQAFRLGGSSRSRISIALLGSCALATAREHVPTRSEASGPRPEYDLPSQATEETVLPARPTGDWGGVRTSLEDLGIAPHAVFATEVSGNIDGGFRDGATNPGLLDFGLELDLEKLVGWKGGGLTVTAFAAYGDGGSAKFTGDFNVASNIFTDTEFNIFNIFLSQEFGDDLIIIKAGQIAADDDFMGAETAGYFLNSAFGPIATESGNVGAPIFPLAAPGAFVRVKPAESFSFQAGFYAGDAGPVAPGNHGFEWRTGGAAGRVIFIEADHNYACGTAKIGGFHHTGELENFRTGSVEEGLGAVYGIVDHRFLEPGGGRPGLSGFVRASIASEDELAAVSRYFDAGLALDSVLMADDAIGLAVSHTIFSDDYLAANPGGTSSETVLELTYQIPVTERWLVQPDIQYIFSPQFSRSDALVIGLRTEVAF